MTVAQMRTEYRSEQAQLSGLAPDWQWPPDAAFRARADDGSAFIYQRGFGRQAADFRWYCSWAQRAVAPRATPAQRVKALATAAKVRDTYYYKTSLQDESRTFIDGVLSKAELGDTGPLANDVRLNCDKKAL